MSESTKHIALIVEDDFASRQYLKFLLKRFNIEVISAESGEQALEAMKDAVVDIMLLDIALGPGITGIQLCERLKLDLRFSETPAIAVTAFAKDNLKEFERVGFSDYLAKPYTIDQLKVHLSKYLNLD
ncbi:MAG: response regulator [Candidatus Marinimicrobia bacterium]|nr:response regulator [Candidatus Neomarinimicrobiota bacterium]